MDMQDAGADISYCCAHCCDCQVCKNAEKVEKILLGEESGQYDIQNLLEINWAGEKITGSLALRGQEHDFLT